MQHSLADAFLGDFGSKLRTKSYCTRMGSGTGNLIDTCFSAQIKRDVLLPYEYFDGVSMYHLRTSVTFIAKNQKSKSNDVSMS